MMIKGIIPPMISPLKDTNTLDVEGTERLVEHLIAGGVHGLFILGTTGEGPSLSHALRIELINEVCTRVNKRVPVLVGVIDTSFEESLYISKKAKEYGAQAIVLAPPCFFQISQTELYNYTDQFLREVSLPVYLYDNPALTKVSYGLEILEKLCTRPEVIGFKDSSGNMVNFQKLAKLSKELNIFLLIGPEELLMEALIMGGNGGVPGGANIFPKLYVDIYNSVNEGNINQAKKLQNKVLELSNIVYSGSDYGSSSIISGIKSALEHLNICSGQVAKPLGNIDKMKSQKVKKFVTDF